MGLFQQPGQFDAVHYAGMELFKIGILLLNLVPYVALRIIACIGVSIGLWEEKI